MSSVPPYLKPIEVAELLRVSTQTVYRWMRSSDPRGIRLASVRTGGYGTRCREDWVVRFMRGEQVPEEETRPAPKQSQGKVSRSQRW